ncbi:MAG: class I SAM-dependent methyltransferase [Hyphomicrobiales bacterium]|nr:MAG: class I SAM-dependent methyltransferase [Hyphomicrobiales bacterium]
MTRPMAIIQKAIVAARRTLAVLIQPPAPASDAPAAPLANAGVTAVTASEASAARSEVTPYIEGQSIRLVFLVQHASSWACWRSIWLATQRDPQFVVKVILTPFVHHLTSEAVTFDTLKQQMLDEGVPFHPLAYFDLEVFAPHVAFVQNPYDETRPHHIRMPALASMGTRVVYVPYGLEMGAGAWNHCAQFDTEVHRRAWRIYSRSERHRQMLGKHCAVGNGHVVVTGHPKFDVDDESPRSATAAQWLHHAAGRKIVLWTPHFSVAGAPAWSTYNVYGQFILEEFERQPGLFLLMRPHPMFFSALRQATTDGAARVDALRERIKAMPNAALDELPSHADAFRVSHALMADVGSFLLEYLPQDKPMLYLELERGIGMNDDGDVTDSFYVAKTTADIEQFLGMVDAGQDPRANERPIAIQNFLYRMDKGAGARIFEDIKQSIRRAEPAAATLSQRRIPALDLQSHDYWQNAQSTFLASDAYYATKEEALKRTLEALGPVETAIDIGCGTGRYTLLLAQYVRDVQAYDVSVGLVSQAQEAATTKGVQNVRFHCAEIERVLPAETFDLVACMGVTSCLIDDLTFLAAIDKLMQLARPGGHVLLVDTLSTEHGHVSTDASGYVAHYRAATDYQKILEKRGLQLTSSTILATAEDRRLINSLSLYRTRLRHQDEAGHRSI